MKRIDTKDGLFDDGNHVFGIHGTRVSAEFLNDIQEEIVNVIGAKNLDGSKRDQLITAIRNIVKSGGGSSSGSAITQADQDKIDSSYHKLKHFVEDELGIALDAKNDAQLKTAIDSAIAKLQAQLDVIKTEQLSQNNKINTIAQIDIRVGDNSTSIADIRKKMTNGSTETTAGVAEIATQDEANNGTDDSKIVTPKKLKVITSDLDRRATRIRNDVDVNTAAIVKLKQNGGTTTTTSVSLATETTAGKAEIATQQEATDGTDDSRIVTPKKLKTITRDLDSRATRIRNDVDRNTADLVTHRTDIQQNTTDIVSNTASIATIISTLKKGVIPTTADKLAQSFTVPSVLHDKIKVSGEDTAGHYGYALAMHNDYLAISDPVLQEVVIYHRDKNNKKVFNLEDIHKGKKHGAIFVEDGQVYAKRKDGKYLDVFEYDETQATLTFKKVNTINLTASYGNSLAINDDYLIVGNPQSKTVLVYKHEGIQWQLVKQLSGGDSFGSSVAVMDVYFIIAETDNKKIEIFDLNYNKAKTLTGGASYSKLISANNSLLAVAETDNNILKIYNNLTEIASKTVKADCISLKNYTLLATSKVDKKAYIYSLFILHGTGWFTTTETKWQGIPDSANGYTGYNIAGGQYQLVRPVGATDTYTKYKGGAWIKNGNWGGVLFYDGAKIGFEKVLAGTGKITITDSTNVSYGFGFLDASGQWWVGTRSAGIVRFDTTTGRITRTDNTDAVGGFGFLDTSGQSWVGTTSAGIGRLNTNTGKITTTDSTNVSYGFGFLDTSGQWWVGTRNDGVGRFNTNTGIISITDSTSVGEGFGFLDTSRQAWVGTRSSGIGRLNTTTGKITITDSTNVLEGFSFLDTSGQAWVGTRNDGIGRLNTTTGKITITDSTNVLGGFGFVDTSGQSWVGTTSSGIGRLNTNTGKISITDSTRVGQGFGFVDTSGRAWVGTATGIGRLDTNTKNQLYLETTDGKHYYNNKEVKDDTKFDSVMQDVAPLPTLPDPIPQANRNVKLTTTDVQEQPNKTGNYVSLLGIGTATTPTDITNSTDTNFAIDNNFGDACAITTDKILITNKTDSKLAIYDHKGTKQKEIQLETGVGSVIDATDTEAIVGSETANTVDVINLKI